MGVVLGGLSTSKREHHDRPFRDGGSDFERAKAFYFAARAYTRRECRGGWEQCRGGVSHAVVHDSAPEVQMTGAAVVGGKLPFLIFAGQRRRGCRGYCPIALKAGPAQACGLLVT